ncbi:hypothetical protein VTN00DRAFT_507 [Thermoascus crustaceus]|uniref:uncharacterized protein n=1 Tax=Thermoascus crustaceus TaxID=5088 RepID=UPI003743239D
MSATPTLGNPGLAQQPAPVQPQQLNRSCESCRALKAKRACIFIAPQRRRPRKRTDSRVAQLEKEMRAMRSLLKDRRFTIDESGPEDTEHGKETDDVDFGASPKEKESTGPDVQGGGMPGPSRSMDHSQGFRPTSMTPGEGGSFTGTSYNNTHNHYSPDLHRNDDVIDRGIISMETANELVAIFINELVQFFPVVVLPADTTASQLRQSKPVLFLSVIAAAAIAVDSSLAMVLNREIVRLYAERFFIEGEKSLELVQALLVMIAFYFPPDSPLKLQFYQYTHVAATMALEIGLASKRRVSRKPADGRGVEQYDTFDEHIAEQARAILGCYHLASNVAMRTRRPNILLFNDWISECVNHLDRSPRMTDRHLAAWFGLQRIVDEAMSSFGLDDTSSATTLTEARIQAVLRWFDDRMQAWKKNTSPDLLTVPMMLEYHHTNLAVYELAVGEGYRDPDAIKRRYYTLPSLDDGNPQQPSAPLSAVRVDMTMKWLNAARVMLDTFLDCDTETMRRIPNIIYTRVGLGVMALLKIYFSVRSGAMRKIIAPENVNVDMYLEAMTRRLTEASAGLKYKIPGRWLYVVGVKARDWYDRLQNHQAQKEANLQGQLKAANSVGTSSSSTAPSPVTIQNDNVQFDPVHPPRIDHFTTQPCQSHCEGSSSSGYGGPAAAVTWPPDDSIFNLNQPSGYPPGGALQQPMQFDMQNFPGAFGQYNNLFPVGSGIELDDWIPDGSIFALPSLPGF